MSDLDFSYRKLLLHLNGTAGSTTFTDSSFSARTVYALGTAELDTTSPKFGSASATMGSLGAIEIRDVSGLTLSGDFTLEWQAFRGSATSGSDAKTLLGFLQASGTEWWWLYVNGSPSSETGQELYFDPSAASGLTRKTAAITWAYNTWKHVAWERVGSANTIYLDGVSTLTFTYAGTITPENVFMGAFVVSAGTIDPSYPDGWVGKFDEIRFTVGLSEYGSAFTPPAAEFEEGVAIAGVDGYAAADSMLGESAVLGSHAVGGRISADLLGAPSMVGEFVAQAWVSVDSPLGAAQVVGAHDFTGLLDYGQPIYYVMDLVTPGGLVRVPISSWQATLNAGRAGYGQAVVPSAESHVEDLTDATEFVISRVTSLTTGGTVEHEMARTPADYVTVSQGQSNYTATMYGYPAEWDAVADPPTAYDRVLEGVRQMTTDSSGTRVRCAIDWLLRPGQRAYAGATPIIVGYINYYVPAGSDEYMDIGEMAG